MPDNKRKLKTRFNIHSDSLTVGNDQVVHLNPQNNSEGGMLSSKVAKISNMFRFGSSPNNHSSRSTPMKLVPYNDDESVYDDECQSTYVMPLNDRNSDVSRSRLKFHDVTDLNMIIILVLALRVQIFELNTLSDKKTIMLFIMLSCACLNYMLKVISRTRFDCICGKTLHVLLGLVILIFDVLLHDQSLLSMISTNQGQQFSSDDTGEQSNSTNSFTIQNYTIEPMNASFNSTLNLQ